MYQDYFRTLIEKVREEDQTLDFSLSRSLRRGAVLETTTHKVDVQVIGLINDGERRRRLKAQRQGSP